MEYENCVTHEMRIGKALKYSSQEKKAYEFTIETNIV